MGSFNVSCSISSISIGHGTKVAFFPLLPNDIHKIYGKPFGSSHAVLEPSCYLVGDSAYALFRPFSLPIIGEYNDYGSLENIEENTTAKVLVDYFNIPIEQIVECIGGRRGMYDYFSSIFGNYASQKELVSEHNIKFNSDWLTKIGFTKTKDNTYNYPGHTVSVEIFEVKEEKLYGYRILSDEKDVIAEQNKHLWDAREKFLSAYYEATNYYLLYDPKDFEKIDLLKRMSGMFVHYDIYRLMCENTFDEFQTSDSNPRSWINEADLSDYTLRKLGFTLKCVDESIERFHNVYEFPGVTDYVVHCDGTFSHIAKISSKHPNGKEVHTDSYHPISLIRNWKAKTGVEIIVQEDVANESVYGAIFDAVREEHLEFLKTFEETDIDKEKEIYYLLKTDPIFLKDKVDEIRNILGSRFRSDEDLAAFILEFQKKQINKRNSILERSTHYLPLQPGHGSNTILPLYAAYVEDGTIRQDIIDFCNFYFATAAMNKVFMPVSCGFQFGVPYATLKLAEKTAELIKTHLKQYEEEED